MEPVEQSIWDHTALRVAALMGLLEPVVECSVHKQWEKYVRHRNYDVNTNYKEEEAILSKSSTFWTDLEICNSVSHNVTWRSWNMKMTLSLQYVPFISVRLWLCLYLSNTCTYFVWNLYAEFISRSENLDKSKNSSNVEPISNESQVILLHNNFPNIFYNSWVATFY